MRAFILIALFIPALFAAPSAVAAAEGGARSAVMYKNPFCGCCGQWAEHLEKAGFKVKVEELDDPAPIRRKLGVSDRFASCHTAKIGGIVVEGHVPAADIERLLSEQSDPKTAKSGVVGLAAPGMPQGSPGMDSAYPEDYDTLLIKKDGSFSVYQRHSTIQKR